MNQNENIFMTKKQVLDAIRLDFKQYDSQFDLFQQLCPIITNNTTIVTREGRNTCVLITRGRKSKIRKINDQELGEYLVNTLSEKTYPLSVISDICSKVFQTKSWPDHNDETGTDGIWLETEMALFQCRQCGNCCRNLKYHNDCNEADYMKWKALGRKDILEKVLTIPASGNRKTVYKIWREPGTRRLYIKCPWLIPSGTNGRYACQIQDVKPEHCRQYPLTRKHARLTGCKGTFKEQKI